MVANSSGSPKRSKISPSLSRPAPAEYVFRGGGVDATGAQEILRPQVSSLTEHDFLFRETPAPEERN
jgi:hypothetical protein